MNSIKSVRIESPPYCRTEINLMVEWAPGGAVDAREDLRIAMAEALEQIRDLEETP